MSILRGLGLAGVVTLGACAVEVTDETSPTLSYNPPLNAQTFTVRVETNATVQNVDLIVPGVGVDTMSPAGSDLYQGQLPIGVCSGIAEFEVEVTTGGLFSDPVDRFPEAGLFTHAITGQPEECEDFAGDVSQTFTVNHDGDFPDLIPGNGTCGAVVGGEVFCTLRAAVMEANAKPGTDLIRVPIDRYVLTRTEIGAQTETGNGVNDSILDLDITESVTIEATSGASRDVWDFLVESNDPADNLTDDAGNNNQFVKVDGNGIDRVFQVSGGGTVLRLRTLAVVNGSSDGPGGGILNEGTLVLEQVALADNEVTKPSATGIGGGAIQNDGLMVAHDIALTHNVVGENVANPQGGGIFNTGTATMRRGLLAYNDARFGNAIHNDDDGTFVLENVTIHDHKWNGGSPVTVLRNEGQMDLAFVTFSENRIGDRTLISSDSAADTTLRNVLAIDNTAAHCSGPMTTLGGNVIEAPCTLTGTPNAQNTDHIDVSLNAFGGLDDRGGFTPIYPFSVPGEGGIAFNPLDKGAVLPFPFTDQRSSGFSRAVDGDGDGPAWPDPGAYEYDE